MRQHILVTCLLVLDIVVAADTQRDWSKYPMQSGKFDQSWESLATYEVPEWFRDAKFGIWAIIGPQCVPLQGDWYARNMYMEGSRQYEHHVKTYGHPSKFGYKDLIARFNPEKLDYEKLVGLYKQAGAKYAVILAVHHDNFDLWDSKYHEWNSVKKGPERDLVGEFCEAALKHNLRFGVTTHLARSYSWLQTSHGADKEGPMKGVLYDGADPKYQSLYHPPFEESPRYPKDPPDPWKLQWYLRVKNLIDQYQPDLMYFDGGYPFDEGLTGRRLVAHYYNANSTWHIDRNDAAMCIKKWPVASGHGQFRDGTCIQDIERGRADDLRDLPWQTDTCIGGWYYRQGIRYKTVSQIVHMLIDIVSKNGNLLLNIPLHPSGDIDQQEVTFLEEMGKWMSVNGQGLYGTRPWIVFGEGPTTYAGGHFNEKALSYTPQDIRFTAKGDTDLYAFFMAWPANSQIKIRSLARPLSKTARVGSVTMVGRKELLAYEHSADGLVVKLPETQPCEYAWCLHIKGHHLRDFDVKQLKKLITPPTPETLKAPTVIEAVGGTVTLWADKAGIQGDSPKLEKKTNMPKSNLGYWNNPKDFVFWDLEVKEAGWYDVSVNASSSGVISQFSISTTEQSLTVNSKKTSGWDDFVTYKVGQIQFKKPGMYQLTFKPASAETWHALGLISVKLTKK